MARLYSPRCLGMAFEKHVDGYGRSIPSVYAGDTFNHEGDTSVIKLLTPCELLQLIDTK
jgi:hypothetical protein